MNQRRALEGVKIADFTWIAAGPNAIKFAANLGAEVIRIESNTRPDFLRFSPPAKDGVLGMNRSALISLFNDSKFGITLNLKIPQAQQVARKIVYEWADVVADSHMPGVMEKWGLDYETLRKEKPDLIHVATTLQGQTGTYSSMPGWGPIGSQLAGFSLVTGWPDREPSIPYAGYSDVVAFPHMVTALIGALIYRERTGKGQFIDVSQLQCCIQFMAPPIMDYMINAQVLTRMGNRATNAAPHAVFRCLGDDRWCAIAVFTDEEWTSFCNVIGNPEWTRNLKFSTVRGRKENENELNLLIEQWTMSYPAEEVMRRMQAGGGAAGLAVDGEDIVNDPQLNHRGTHVIIEHPEIGPHIHQLPPYRLSKTPPEIRMPAPCIGQHNEYILKDVLGMSDEEISDLVAAGGLE